MYVKLFFENYIFFSILHESDIRILFNIYKKISVPVPVPVPVPSFILLDASPRSWFCDAGRLGGDDVDDFVVDGARMGRRARLRERPGDGEHLRGDGIEPVEGKAGGDAARFAHPRETFARDSFERGIPADAHGHLL